MRLPPELNVWSYCCVYDTTICENKKAIQSFVERIVMTTETLRSSEGTTTTEQWFRENASFASTLNERRKQFNPVMSSLAMELKGGLLSQADEVIRMNKKAVRKYEEAQKAATTEARTLLCS